MLWLILALCTAFFEATKDVYIKYVVRKIDTGIVILSMWLYAVPFLAIILVIMGIPPLQPYVWGILLLNGILLAISGMCIVRGLKLDDVSVTVPLLSFTPALLLITSPLIVGEFPSLGGLFGILLIVIGSYVLNLSKRKKSLFAPFKALIERKGSRLFLVAAAIYSITANTDKIGMEGSSPFFWGTAQAVAVSLCLLIYMLFRQDRKIRQLVKPSLVLLGLIFATLVTFHMIALQLTIVPYLIAIKRTSILIGIIMAHFLFKERNFSERFSGATLMVLGVALIAFS